MSDRSRLLALTRFHFQQPLSPSEPQFPSTLGADHGRGLGRGFGLQVAGEAVGWEGSCRGSVAPRGLGSGLLWPVARAGGSVGAPGAGLRLAAWPPASSRAAGTERRRCSVPGRRAGHLPSVSFCVPLDPRGERGFVFVLMEQGSERVIHPGRRPRRADFKITVAPKLVSFCWDLSIIRWPPGCDDRFASLAFFSKSVSIF